MIGRDVDWRNDACTSGVSDDSQCPHAQSSHDALYLMLWQELLGYRNREECD